MSKQFSRFTAFATILSTGSLICSTSLTAQTPNPPSSNPTAAVTAEIVRARDYTSEFVSLAKASFAPNSADQINARELYADAYSKYNAWVAYVTTSVRQGKAKKLSTDNTYQKIADDASNSALQFTNFVDSKTHQEKAISTILSGFADLGLKLWNGIKDRRDRDRNNAADAFKKDAEWQPWDKIGSETQNEKKPSAPNNE